MNDINCLIKDYQGADWRNIAETYLIDGVGTFSKRWDQFVEHVYPTHIQGQTGAMLHADDGHDYIDWVGALGANINGTDISHSLPTIWECILAHKLSERVGMYMWKFLREGSAACSAALRYARASTGRLEVWGTGYHGYHDHFIASESPGLGCIPGHYHKHDSLSDLLRSLRELDNKPRPAAVIIEPVILVPEPELIREIRFRCRQNNIIFIADEIVSGGRYLQFNASQYYGLDPDILVLGKPIAGGHPAGFVGIKEHVVTKGVFVSTTFAGSIDTIHASIRYLIDITDDRIQELWDAGKEFRDAFNNLSTRVQLIGYPTRMTWDGTDIDIAFFWQEMCRRGHLLGKAFFPTFSNMQYFSLLLEDSKEVLHRIDTETMTLDGLLPRPVFRRY